MKKVIVVIVGESASGKSTVEKCLKTRFKHFSDVVSCTTRPIRDGESDGISYNFVSEEEYEKLKNNNLFAETGEYNGWKYGSLKSSYFKTENDIIAVLTPHGMRQIKESMSKDYEVVSFYLKVPRRDRLIKCLKRGDDVEEAIRRNQSDVGQFDGVETEVDYVIRNNGYMYTPYQLADEIVDILKERFKWEKEKK